MTLHFSLVLHRFYKRFLLFFHGKRWKIKNTQKHFFNQLLVLQNVKTRNRKTWKVYVSNDIFPAVGCFWLYQCLLVFCGKHFGNCLFCEMQAFIALYKIQRPLSFDVDVFLVIYFIRIKKSRQFPASGH